MLNLIRARLRALFALGATPVRRTEAPEHPVWILFAR